MDKIFSKGRNWIALIAFAILVCAIGLMILQFPKQPSPEEVVTGLYEAYPEMVPLVSRDFGVLRRYFDESLVALFAEEVECRKRQKYPVCRIDWDVLYDTQDEGGDPAIGSFDAETHQVPVAIGNDPHRVLRFQMTKNPDGWRVNDILYEDTTLREVLGQPLDGPQDRAGDAGIPP